MFNFKNKITSWYYKYTDKLLIDRLQSRLNFNKSVLDYSYNGLYKYSFRFIVYVFIPFIVIIFIFLLLDNLLSDQYLHYLKYPAIICVGYIVLALLSIIIQFIIFIIRKRLFKNLLIFLCYFISILLYALLEKFLKSHNYFSFNKFFVDFSILYVLFIFIQIFIIKKYNKQ